MEFTPDGEMLAVAEGTGDPAHGVMLTDINTGDVTRVLRQRSEILTLEVSRDGSRLVTGGEDGRIVVWDSATHERLAERIVEGPVYAVAISPDARHLVAAGRATSLLGLNTLELIREFPVGAKLSYATTFLADGNVAVACDGVITLWDVTGHKLAKADLEWTVRSLASSPQGGLLAVGGRPDAGRAELWTTKLERRLAQFSIASGAPTDAAFEPSGKRFYVSTASGAVEEWNVAKEKRTNVWTSPQEWNSFKGLAVNQDSVVAASGSGLYRIR